MVDGSVLRAEPSLVEDESARRVVGRCRQIFEVAVVYVRLFVSSEIAEDVSVNASVGKRTSGGAGHRHLQLVVRLVSNVIAPEARIPSAVPCVAVAIVGSSRRFVLVRGLSDEAAARIDLIGHSGDAHEAVVVSVIADAADGDSIRSGGAHEVKGRVCLGDGTDEILSGGVLR